MARLDVDYSFCSTEIDKLSELHQHLAPLPPKYQKLVAEIVMLRLFYLLENTFASLATKMVCGAQYLDGTNPNVLVPARSAAAAKISMMNHGRAKPMSLKWTKASYIKDNLKHVIDPSEHFVTALDHQGSFIDEMRRVRNRIAHNNPGSRTNYRMVVQRHYGAYLNSITPGILLLAPRTSPPLITQYLAKSKILVKTIVKA